MFADVVSGFLDLLAPPACAACDAELSQPELGFCAACAPLLEPAPAHGDDGVHCAQLYGGPLAQAIQRFKYGGRTELLPALARLMDHATLGLAGEVDVVLCVPLHRTRLVRRGFNQSALLGAKVAARLGLPFRPTWLRRVRRTSPQVGLSAEERSRNLRGAFRASPKVRDKRVLVVDDVSTTGTTLSEVQRALREQGASKVATLCLALAEPEDDIEEC